MPLAQHVRIVHEDAGAVTLEDVYEEYCRRHGCSVNDPIYYSLEKQREYHLQAEVLQSHRDIKKELFEEIRKTMAPATILGDYMLRTLPDYSSHWVARTTFTRQLACLSFASRILFLNHGPPSAITVLKGSGSVSFAELYPCYDEGVVATIDRVYFRLTPNMVRFMTRLVSFIVVHA